MQVVHLKDYNDSVIWLGNSSEFSTKDLSTKLDLGINGPKVCYFFWKLKIPTRIKVFL